MSEEKHALLSASSSHKWLKCTPSARLEEQFENKSSDYMKEGTLAHAIAEFKVKNYFFDKLSKKSYNARLKKFEKEEFYQTEMLAHTDTYLDYIKELALKSTSAPFVAVEQAIYYDMYAPERIWNSRLYHDLRRYSYNHRLKISVKVLLYPQKIIRSLSYMRWEL